MALEMVVVNSQQQSKIVKLTNGGQLDVAKGDTIRLSQKVNIKTFRQGDDLLITDAKGGKYKLKNFFVNSEKSDEIQMLAWDDEYGIQKEILSVQDKDEAAAVLLDESGAAAGGAVQGEAAASGANVAAESTAAAAGGSESLGGPTVFGLGLVAAGILLASGGSGGGGGGGVVVAPPASPSLSVSDSDADGRVNAIGTAQPGNLVTVTWPDGTISTVTADANGNWSVESPTVQPNGNVTATATNGSGQTSAPTTVAYVDTTLPAAPTLNVNDADADDRINAAGISEPGSTVTVTWPDGTTSTTLADASGNWAIESPTPQASGNVTATATDINGNVSGPTTAPYADATAPAAPTIDPVTVDNIINAAEVGTVITGTNEAGATVALSLGGNTRAATVTGTTWSYTLTAADIAAMGQGLETLSATQTVAGNTSLPVTRNITVDTVVPAAPTINVVASDDIINAAEVGTTITGTNEAGATVALSLGGNTRAATVTGTTWSYTLTAADITAMGQGAETLSATQTDAAGNTSLPVTRNITVDTVVPAAPTINVVASDDIINAAEVGTTITGTNEAGATVALSLGGNTRAATVTGTSWSYTLTAADITAMGQGAETLSATQTDGAGNTSPAATHNVTVDTVIPVVDAAQVINYAENQVADAVIGTVTATDAVGVTGYRFDNGLQTTADGFYTINNSGAISITVDGVAAGVAQNDFETGLNSFTYGVQAGDAAGNWATATNVTLNVTNVNDNTPLVTSGATATFAENGTGTVYTVTASDADGTLNPITFALAGNDADLFDIDSSTGVVTFKTAPDFEAPADFDGNNVYDITVTSSDGTNTSAPRAVAITVTNVNDNTPLVTSGATATFAENGTGTVYTVTASDADGTLNPITYALAGNDADLFDIDSSTGVVTFKTVPDFEAPADFDGNNVYDITVTSSDGTNTSAPRAVAITVTDVVELAEPKLIPVQLLDNVTNLDVRSSLVLTFDQAITLGSGTISILDDSATGWTISNPLGTAPATSDTTKNDVVITLTNGEVTGMTVGGVDYTDLGTNGMTLAQLQASITVSGDKLTINPGGDTSTDASNTLWNFDWDFATNYHVTFSAGVVKNASDVGNQAMTDDTTLNFTTVTPSTAAAGAASTMQAADGTLAAGVIWHQGNVGTPTGLQVTLDFTAGEHALVMSTVGEESWGTYLSGNVKLINFSSNDLIYQDNLGDMLMVTTDGLNAAGWWDDGTRAVRELSNYAVGEGAEIRFDGIVPMFVADDGYLESVVFSNANVVIFG